MTTLLNPGEYEIEDAGIPSTLFAFDLDSVLSNTSYLPIEIANKYNVPTSDIHSLDVDGNQMFNYAVEGVSDNQVYKDIHEIVHEHGPSALPTPFMRDVLRYYHELTRDPIVVVTARHRMNKDITTNWLLETLLDIPFHAIVCHGVPKLPVLQALGCDYFVDDRYKTIFGLQGFIPHPVLYQQPWNQGRKHPASSLQVRDLRDLIPLFNIECGFPPATWPGNIPYPDRIGRGKVVDLYA